MAPTSLPANNGPAAAKPWEASAEKSACATVEHRGHRIIDAAKHRMSAAKPVPGWFFNTRTVLFSVMSHPLLDLVFATMEAAQSLFFCVKL